MDNKLIIENAEREYVFAVRNGVVGFKAKLKAVRILQACGMDFEEALTVVDSKILEWNQKVKFFY